MSDSSSVARALAGDRSALEGLWRDHRRWVATVLLAHKRQDAELEDLLQEVAVILVQRLADLRDPSRFRAWLRAVAVNVARMAARRDGARPTHEALDGVDVVDPSGERAARAEHARGEIERVLAFAMRLDPDYREPLLLRAVDGLGQAAIAEILDLPETTIETRLARARRMLRRELERDARPPVRPGVPDDPSALRLARDIA
ncbi:MAG: RNA polymerase sigma factor [Planctomycetes bacterium]|nr:RNA polymerase sigma factor [Planctomycetota bacterium]